MQKQEHFERYTPQFPLPVDITNMSREDTVCQFCGVSYLIHNEIKALEAKCQKLEADLTFYAGITSRETTLEQKLQNERARIADLESTININTHKLNEMTRRLQLMQDEFDQSKNAHRQTKATFSKYSSNLRSTINQIRNEYSLLQESYAKNFQNWKMHLQTIENTLQKEIQSTMNHHRIEIEQYQQQLNETKQSFRNLQQSQLESKESHTTAQNDLEAAREEIRLHRVELSRLHDESSEKEQARLRLQNEFEQLKAHCQHLERQLLDKEESKKNVDLLIDQYRQQLTNEKELRTTELETVRSKLLQLTNEYEQLSMAKKESESNESHTRRKIEEMNRSRQAVLDRTRDEYEKLVRKYTDLDEIYRELVDRHEQDTSELQHIRSELERLHRENLEFTKQRETMNITHDIQMKKVHETYASKLREAEQWPDRLQAELNREREQHRIQIHELERQLKESFLTELNIEKQKSADLLRKYEQESGYSTKQLRHELISTEKVTIEQRQYYTKQIEQLEKEKEQLKQELDALRDVLKELHEQLTKQESMNSERGNYLQLKEDLLVKERSLFQAQTTIDQLQKEFEQTQDEMTTLQETVHRECTEREQLKDALIDARQQLLTMKKNGILNGKASRSLHSPPVAFEEIEKRVIAPLPYSQTKPPSFVKSESITRDNSIPGDAADLIARPMSSTQHVPYRSKALPPINRSQERRKKLSSYKSDQLMENQRRIARFLKHIK